MNPIRHELMLDAIAASPPVMSGRRVVAIDGPSGSGKTTLAEDLANSTGAPILTVDDLCPGWGGLDRVPGLLSAALATAALGGPLTFRQYDWIGEQLGELVELAFADVLIVDGVGSGSTAVRPYLSVIIWVDGDEATRKRRALARDGTAFAVEWDNWARQERALFGQERTKGAADMVLSS